MLGLLLNVPESSSGLDDEWDKELFGDDTKAVEELAQKIQDGKVCAHCFLIYYGPLHSPMFLCVYYV